MTDGKNKQPHLDILRAAAILMVVMVHTAQQVPGLDATTSLLAGYGQMGVQLFFVVSAYTLCLSHERRAGDPVTHFYIRRLFRIAPLYYVGIAFYFLLRTAAGEAQAYTAGNVLANVFFVHGFVKSAHNSIVPGGWSIGVEMSFYLVFPIAVLLAAWAARRSLWLAALLVAGVVAASVGINGWVGLISRNNVWYYNVLTQLPVFAGGMFAYFALKRGQIALAVAAAGFLGFTAAGLALYASGRPMAYAWLPTVAGVGFAFLLALFQALRPSGRLLQRMGTVSFSMYVVHFAFVWLLAPRIGALGLPPQVALLLAFLAVTACTFGVSILTERHIEARGIRAGERLIARLRAGRAVATGSAAG